MKLTKRFVGVLAAGFLAVGAAGCAGSGAEKQSDPAATTTDDAAATKEIRIGASLLTQSHPFYVSIKESMEEEAKAKGVELTVSIADQDLNKQVAQVEDFVNQQMDAVIISPVDSDGVTGAIKKAQDAGIPVVTIDIPATNIEVDSHVATDNYAGGLIAAEAMAQLIGGQGDVGLITYPEVQSVRDRIDGFKKTMESYPDIDIVKEVPGRDRQAAKAAAEDILTSSPGIAGIFGFGDDMALAATQAVGDAKSDAVVVGFDGMEEALKAVDDDNAFAAVVVQYPGEMGKVAIENAIGLAEGQEVPKLTPITPGLYVHGLGEVPVVVDGDTVQLTLD